MALTAKCFCASEVTLRCWSRLLKSQSHNRGFQASSSYKYTLLYFICIGLHLTSTCLMESNNVVYLTHTHPEDIYFCWYLMATSVFRNHYHILPSLPTQIPTYTLVMGLRLILYSSHIHDIDILYDDSSNPHFIENI